MEEFGTKTALKLLKALFENPLREFKEIELIKNAETGKGAASEIISKLLKKGILLEKRVGKTKLISLNLRNERVYFLKMLFDNEKISLMGRSKLSALLLFIQKAKRYSKLMIVFGSSIAGTVKKESDIDILIVCDNLDDINSERKKVEELFGEKFNIHCYSEDEIKNKMKEDNFIKNAFIKGVIVGGYDFGRELFVNLTLSRDIDRLLFLHERIKSALNNYLKKDYSASKEILDKTMEQLVFFILSNKGVEYTSKKDAYEAILKLDEGIEIKKIIYSNVALEKKINLSEQFILNLIKDEILKGGGYVS